MVKVVIAAAILAVAGYLGFSAVTSQSILGMQGSSRAERTPDNPVNRDFIASVTVEQDYSGTTYRVRPTRAGRMASNSELDIAWRQAVRAGVPDRKGLRRQFLCHPMSIVARAKPTWDLESWRPTVGMVDMMLAGCNPD